MNPEFVRNLWLEASRRRILGMVGVLALIYAAAAFLNHDDGQKMLAVFGVVGLAVYGVCGVIWASRAAGGAVLDEIRGRTWDFQRLSALTPWAMTWGKLLGAGALAWIAALTGLIAAFPVEVSNKSLAAALTMALGLIALVLFLQGCAMGAALVGVRKARAEGRIATSGSVLLGVAGGLILIAVLSGHLPQQASSWGGGGLDLLSQEATPFWGLTLWGPLFVTLSMAAFAAWAVVGAWRLMRLELQMRNSPWIWIAFLLFAGFWRAGIAPAAAGLSGQVLTAAAVFAILTYAAAFVEPADPLRLRRFAVAIGHGDLPQMIELAPAAVSALKLTVICVIASLVIPTGLFGDGVAPATPIAALTFLIRDLGVIAIFRFGPRPGRGDLAAVIAIALLYGVGAVLDGVVRGQGFALFSPFSPAAPLITLIAGVAQAAAAWVIAAQRIGGASSSIGATGST